MYQNGKSDIEKKVKKEINRLKKIYADVPDKSAAEGLIVQAARLRVSLDIMWNDIMENGDTELFTQSEKTEPYERERPVARLFNARDKNYQSIMKQLNDLLPDGIKQSDPGNDLMKFAMGAKK